MCASLCWILFSIWHFVLWKLGNDFWEAYFWSNRLIFVLAKFFTNPSKIEKGRKAMGHPVWRKNWGWFLIRYNKNAHWSLTKFWCFQIDNYWRRRDVVPICLQFEVDFDAQLLPERPLVSKLGNFSHRWLCHRKFRSFIHMLRRWRQVCVSKSAYSQIKWLPQNSPTAWSGFSDLVFSSRSGFSDR